MSHSGGETRLPKPDSRPASPELPSQVAHMLRQGERVRVGALTSEQRELGVRGAGLPVPGPLAFTPRPPSRTPLSLAVPPQPPFVPIHATRRVSAPPGTCGRFSWRPLPSRQSERPWTQAGLGGGRGRPLVAAAAAAAAPVTAPGRGWRGGAAGSSPALLGAFLPGKGVGVPSPEQTWGPRARSLPSRAFKTHL